MMEFPEGEPEGEAPQVGYCASCGVRFAWPNDNTAWPESCPRGCTPLVTTNYPPDWPMTVAEISSLIDDDLDFTVFA
jgi:hypothetical protein